MCYPVIMKKIIGTVKTAGFEDLRDSKEASKLLNTLPRRDKRKCTFRENLPSYLLGAGIAAVILAIICWLIF